MRVAVTIGLIGLVLPGCTRTDPAENPERVTNAAVSEVSVVPVFRAGESVVYVHREITRQGQVTALHSVTREIRETRRFRLETLEAEAGGVARLRLSMERVESSVRDNGEVVFEFDSASPGEPRSGPARARALLAGLVAEMTVAPGGTVLSMSAEIRASELLELPADQRELFAENWFRAVIESVYRPFGDRDVLPVEGSWVRTDSLGPPYDGPGYSVVRESRVAGHDDSRVVVESESELHLGEEARPEWYSVRTRYEWSVPGGHLERLAQFQALTHERVIAGIAGVDVSEREISLERVNPAGSRDDEEGR